MLECMRRDRGRGLSRESGARALDRTLSVCISNCIRIVFESRVARRRAESPRQGAPPRPGVTGLERRGAAVTSARLRAHRGRGTLTSTRGEGDASRRCSCGGVARVDRAGARAPRGGEGGSAGARRGRNG